MNPEIQNARPGEPETGSSGEHQTGSAAAHPLQGGNGFHAKNIEVTLYLGARDTKGETRTLSKCLDIIRRNPSLSKSVEELRPLYWKAEDLLPFKDDNADAKAAYDTAKSIYDEAKKKLPAVTFGGKFRKRCNEGLEAYTGIHVADLDHLKEKGFDIGQFKSRVSLDPHVLFCFVSPSGDGLKIGIRVATGPEDHTKTFLAMQRYFVATYGIKPDDACKEVSRLCFLSYDAEVFENENAVLFDWQAWPEPATIVAEKGGAGSGAHSNGKPDKATVASMLAFIPTRPDYPVWICRIAAVHDALPDDDDAVEVLSKWSPEEKPGEYLEKLRSGLNRVGIGTLIRLAKANGWTDEAPKADSINYSAAILSACDLNAMDIPKRLALLGSWMREGDIGFVFAARGIGKTWLSLLTGNAVAEGAKLGEWEAGEGARTVLYVDGEMSLADSQFRARAIGITAPHFRWLHHEHLYNAQEQTLNIAAPSCQSAISALLDAGSVLILDNLSALCRGIAENDNDAWEAILPWLLSLRRRKVTVIIVHHAGRNGEMRGASRREDAADWILRLRDDTEDDDTREKAIITHFTKCRGCSPKDAPPLRWTLHIGEQITYTCKLHSGPDALAAMVSGGVTEPSECADMLCVARGTVSKWAKKLQTAGRIRIVGRKYLPPADEKENDEWR